MLYNRCTGIYKFGNITYPRRIRHGSNLGHIFQGKKVCLIGREIQYIAAKHGTSLTVISHNLTKSDLCHKGLTMPTLPGIATL